MADDNDAQSEPGSFRVDATDRLARLEAHQDKIEDKVDGVKEGQERIEEKLDKKLDDVPTEDDLADIEEKAETGSKTRAQLVLLAKLAGLVVTAAGSGAAVMGVI